MSAVKKWGCRYCLLQLKKKKGIHYPCNKIVLVGGRGWNRTEGIRIKRPFSPPKPFARKLNEAMTETATSFPAKESMLQAAKLEHVRIDFGGGEKGDICICFAQVYLLKFWAQLNL